MIVRKPELRAEATTLGLPEDRASRQSAKSNRQQRLHRWPGAKLKRVRGLGGVSAAGLPAEVGVLVVEVSKGSAAAAYGLRDGDIILRWGGRLINSVAESTQTVAGTAPDGKLHVTASRNQSEVSIEIQNQSRA